jgi:pheromone shutdown-related protein TraB
LTSLSEQASLEKNSPSEIAIEEGVHKLELLGKSIILIGTAHVSDKSADQVARIIENERPDAVCVELCTQRYETLLRHGVSRQVNLLDIVKGQRGVGFLWFILWYFQKRVGDQLGIKPGMEIIRAVEAAGATGARIHAIDRDISVTLNRAWNMMGFKTRIALAAQLALSLQSINNLKQQDIENLKQEGMIDQAVAELGKSFPALRQVLIDERDQYMAEGIAATVGQKIVAVVGAAHVPGILRQWQSQAVLKQMLTNSPEAA